MSASINSRFSIVYYLHMFRHKMYANEANAKIACKAHMTYIYNNVKALKRNCADERAFLCENLAIIF